MPDELIPNGPVDSNNDPDDPRNLWQQQEGETVTITIDDLRRETDRFRRRWQWRNTREYSAAVVVVVALTAQLSRLHGWYVTPQALGIAAAIFVMFQMHRRGGVRPVSADLGLAPTLQLHRQELERQRDAIRSVWSWYLLPMVPYFLAQTVVFALDTRVRPILPAIVVAIILVFVAVWQLNRRAARKLDRKLQEVSSLEKDDR